MLRKKKVSPVSGELVILTLCLVLVMITLSQILVVHHKFSGKYTRVVRPNNPKARKELRQLERSIAALMRQNVPSIEQHKQILQSQVFASRIKDIIFRASMEANTSISASVSVPTKVMRAPASRDYSGLVGRGFEGDKNGGGHGSSTLQFKTGNLSDILCGAIPEGLEGPLNVNASHSHDDIRLVDVIEENVDIQYGGKWKPKSCFARYRVAIIIPYRDRLHHLVVLLAHLLPILRRQQLDFRVFVVEQFGNDTFNKGRIMNAAFKEALKIFDFQCVVFHDVDLIPEDDRNMYSCPWQPRHMSVAIDEMDYRLKYDILVGGVLNLRVEHYQELNGYSNMYWGWGAEDDDMAYRILHVGFKITRPPSTIARYKMIKHQKRRPTSWHTRSKLLHTAVKRYKMDGLNSVSYKLMFIHDERLFTHIMVDVGKP
ncbi:beta-1,4-N-acetylgalactosaminyltransferase bre-4-like isoform X1 [Haliotis cracherodii]|uniref:beta-1,4-N-acetylgalactosaminyltransferase bre-4-like isoform X1 n=1 Tax=Haliotis cracherodii TaxID=6455 RepID=UPI0039EA4394